MYIAWFRDLTMADVPKVGGKNASLGEMVRHLAASGVPVPDGFATTAEAFRHFLAKNQLEVPLEAALHGLDLDDVADLQRRGKRARELVGNGGIPDDLLAEIRAAYTALGEPTVAVRSSATAEDLPEASFAGQQETFLNVQGAAELFEAVRLCFASLYTDRAISYRAERGFGHDTVALSVGIQRMVRSDLASAGVAFTLDPETGFRDVVLVTGSWGLGESVVQGVVGPDEWVVHKPLLEKGFTPLIRRNLGTKEMRLVADTGGGRRTRTEPVPEADRRRFSLSDAEVLALSRMAITIEKHYSAIRGQPTPMDIEWAKDGVTGELFVVQARPETVQSRATVIERFHRTGEGRVLVRGRAVGSKIASGPARIIRSVAELASFRDGEVLIAERTDPDWEPVMRRAHAIVTDRGGRTCHAAIVSRELGVPAVVGCGNATEGIETGQVVTVSCAEGEVGIVFEGVVPFEVDRRDAGTIPRPRTRVMMNVGDPAEAFRLAALPNDGVGLAREEFIVSAGIGIHPMALVDAGRRPLEPAVQAEIDRRTDGAPDKASFFVDRLAEGIGTIAAAFWPKDVLARLSDFKSNEYAGLVGGSAYEPHEENPMIGFRGASRYTDDRYRAAFALECRALRRVREEWGLENLIVLVPFCRTLDEARRVIAELAANGLVRGAHHLQLYLMCEVPSNVVLIEAFAELFDGFSIGSNDLTQLTLGVDRDSELLADVFDERDPAVLWMIRHAIAGARRASRKIGICGQAPSDYPEFAKILVEAGIDSISLNPDTVIEGMARIHAAETAVRPLDKRPAES